MNRKKKYLAPVLIFALTTMMLVMGAGSVYAQKYQTATLDPSSLQVNQGDLFEVTLTYDVSDGDNQVGAFGIGIYYDSANVSYVSYTSLSADAEAFRQPAPNAALTPYDDTSDAGGFGATGKLLGVLYFTTDGKFPNATLPLDLFKLQFSALNNDAITSIKVIGVQAATGYEIQGSESAVTIGTVTPTATAVPIDAAAAMKSASADLVIIDANATAYETEKIAGAVLKTDLDLATLDKATPILVYCRDAAVAKTEAESLVAQGFTDVYYLNDTFANFAADVMTVTNDMVQYKLTVTTVGTGTVTGNSADGFHNRNTAVTLVADPAANVTWSGDTTDGNVTMDASKSVTATFAGAVCTASFTATVGTTVVTAPNTLTVTQGDTVVFDASASVGAASYTWDFETMSLGTDSGVTVTKTIPATMTPGSSYQVVLQLDCGTTATMNVTVQAAQVCDLTAVDIVASPASGTEPLSVGLTATVTGTADTYAWSVTDASGNSVATGANNTLSLSALAAGTYTVNLTASNSNFTNCTVSDTATITVEAQPSCVASFTITPNPVTVGNSVTLDASASTPSTGGTITSYAWTITDPEGNLAGNPGGVTAVKQAIQEGTYTVKLKITDNQQCTHELTQTFVSSQQVCDLTAVEIVASPSGGEEPLNVALSATVTGTADTYAWSVTDASGSTVTTGTSATLNLTALGEGNYTVALTVSNSAIANCTASDTALIQVSAGSGTPDGDGNSDGYTDIFDALLAAMYDAEINLAVKADYEAMPDFWMLDVVQDGVVDINDALAIARYDVGLTCTCVLDQ